MPRRYVEIVYEDMILKKREPLFRRI